MAAGAQWMRRRAQKDGSISSDETGDFFRGLAIGNSFYFKTRRRRNDFPRCRRKSESGFQSGALQGLALWAGGIDQENIA